MYDDDAIRVHRRLAALNYRIDRDTIDQVLDAAASVTDYQRSKHIRQEVTAAFNRGRTYERQLGNI